MMDRDAPAPPGVWSAPTDQTCADGSSPSGTGPTSTGARPLEGSHACRKRKASAHDAPSTEASSSASSAGEEVEDELGQGRGRRGHDEEHGYDAVSSLDSDAGSGGESPDSDADDGAESLAAPAVQISKDALASRASKVFVVGADWPAEIRKPLLAPLITNEIVKLAIEVCNDLCNRDGKSLSRSFGNFDRRVALGSWLLADAAGKPLLTREAAHARAWDQGAARCNSSKGGRQHGQTEGPTPSGCARRWLRRQGGSGRGRSGRMG